MRNVSKRANFGGRITLLKIFTEVPLSGIKTSLLQILWDKHWLVKLFFIA